VECGVVAELCEAVCCCYYYCFAYCWYYYCFAQILISTKRMFEPWLAAVGELVVVAVVVEFVVGSNIVLLHEVKDFVGSDNPVARIHFEDWHCYNIVEKAVAVEQAADSLAASE
jgi:hypothetical protein